MPCYPKTQPIGISGRRATPELIARLERLVREPSPYVSPARIRIDPRWNPLREDPHFAALIAD